MDRANQRDLVRRGYDVVSRASRDAMGRSNPKTAEDVVRYDSWIGALAQRLAPAARILDLGCGSGLPATKRLVEMGFDVVGLDFSSVQIERAQELVKGAKFIEADMAIWDCAPASFDAVVCFYALIHVPLADQRDLFPRIRRWLTPGGTFLGIVGHKRWRGVEEYLGAPMFWDHADTATYLDWLREAGLEPVWDRFVPEGDSGHPLVLAVASL